MDSSCGRRRARSLLASLTGLVAITTYRAAIDRTAAALERRARCFRHQVVAVILVSCGCVMWAVLAGAAMPLLGLLSLVPVCGLFLIADERVLDGWRSEILTAWAGRLIDLSAFSAAIRGNPILPTATAEGMLLTLPRMAALDVEQRIAAPTRRAIAAENCEKHRLGSDLIALKTAAGGIVVAALLVAVAGRGGEAVATLSVLALLPVVRAWLRHLHGARSRLEVAACRIEPDFSESDWALFSG